MDAERIRRSIDDASRDLLVREPYYGHLLVGTVRAAASGDFGARLVPLSHAHLARLEVAATSWQRFSPVQRKAALKHELLHLTLKHPLRARAFPLLTLWGLACDLVVNQLLDSSELEEAVTIADFAELGLAANRTADEYYELLKPLWEACVHGSTSPHYRGRAEATMRRCLAEQLGASHRTWAEFAALSSASLSVFETNVDALIEATVHRAQSRSWGRMPGGLVELLEGLIRKRAEIPWRRIVRLFGATSERTWLKNTLSRPSKRYGTCPGIRVRRRTAIVVAVDTSGSIAAKDIEVFFSEVHGMWRRGVQVTVLECDAAVRREYPYRGSPPLSASGRGGTSFDPAIARANELRADALVYFTDGDAPEPEVRARMPLLWVLSRDGCALDEALHLPGRRVKLSVVA